MIKKLCVCYIPALDLRRINPENTPFIDSALQNYPWVKIHNMPAYDNLPTILTGVYPQEHGIDVILRSDLHPMKDLLVRTIPDMLSTTFQCFLHFFNPSFDLATVPTWRRKRFVINRTKYISKSVSNLINFGDIDSFFKIIGEKKSKYIFTKDINDLKAFAQKSHNGEDKLVMIEIYSLDLIQHWYLDDVIRIIKAYKLIDHVFETLQAKFFKNDEITLMFLSDHGQERIIGTIDVKGRLNGLGLSKDDYTFFIETTKARFWFHTDHARDKISDMLSFIEHGSVLSYQDLQQYNLRYPDNRYGDSFFFPDAGYIIFPHDFYHPLANLFLGLTDKQQRSRIFNPIHRGHHNYLPHSESEKGFMMLLDQNYKAIKKEAELIDFAPTVLKLLGYEKPDFMKGQCIFTV